MPTTCAACGKEKEPTRPKSMTCRACDGASRKRRADRGFVSIHLDPDDLAAVRTRAASSGLTPSEYVRRAVLDTLDQP